MIPGLYWVRNFLYYLLPDEGNEFLFITPVYLQSVHNTISKWEETETIGEEESSVALIHMEEAQGLEWARESLQTEP
jgi:hypothetical protein